MLLKFKKEYKTNKFIIQTDEKRYLKISPLHSK